LVTEPKNLELEHCRFSGVNNLTVGLSKIFQSRSTNVWYKECTETIHETQHISTVTGYGVVNKGSFPEGWNFYFHHHIYTNSGTHPIFNLTGPGISSIGKK
jgi:hypothetical protein